MLLTGSPPIVHQSRPARLELHHQDAGLIVASFGVVCVAIWSSKPTPVLFEIQRAHLATAVLRHPGRALFMCVVDAKADAPEQAERDGSSKMISGHGDKLAGCACVIEGNGFRAAITRTVLTGITFVIRTPGPISFFDNVGSACTWLQVRSGGADLSSLPSALQLEREKRLTPL